jgi:hypothetical protein
MKKIVLVFGILLLSACGYDGGYRYSCQDPENWGTPECNPPICRVDGNCTDILLGFDPFEQEGTTKTTTTQEIVAP